MVDLSHLPLEFTGELFALTDKPDELTPQDGSYLADVVSDLDLVRIVTSHARGPVWFRWGTKDPGANLYCETPLDDEVFLELAYRAETRGTREPAQYPGRFNRVAPGFENAEVCVSALWRGLPRLP